MSLLASLIRGLSLGERKGNMFFIGTIRRFLFMPFSCTWNSWVRDITAKLEGTFLIPTFMRLTTSLNPAVVLIAILLGGQLAGVIGFILAVPGAVLVQEVINHWSETKMKRKMQIENVQL